MHSIHKAGATKCQYCAVMNISLEMCLNMRPEKLRAKYYDLAQLTRIIRGFGMYWREKKNLLQNPALSCSLNYININYASPKLISRK